VNRISNAWRIAQASWQVLLKDRALAAVPVVAGIAALLVFAVVAMPGFLLLNGTDAVETGNVALWLVALVAATGASWMMAIGQATIIAGAAERMDGGNPTVGSAFEVAKGRAGRLLEWAFLSTIVATVLDMIEERLGILGRIVSWIGAVAFAVMSFLALPIIVFEDVGAIEAFKRSSRLLRGTWGEQLTFTFGIGLLGFVATLPALLVFMLFAATGVAALIVLGLVAALAWVLVVSAVTSALSAIYKAALYRWANDLPVDAAFSESDFTGAFAPRRNRRSFR
jgi:hypothetical protein